MGEMAGEQRLELAARQLAHMIGVGRAADRRVGVAVGRADEQQAVRPQHPPQLAQDHVLLGQVLQRLEQDGDVDRGVRQVQGVGVALLEHILAAAEIARQQVAVIVLDLDLTRDRAGQPLAAERQRRGGGLVADEFTHLAFRLVRMVALSGTVACRPVEASSRPQSRVCPHGGEHLETTVDCLPDQRFSTRR